MKISGVYEIEAIERLIEAGADGFTFNFSKNSLNHEVLRDLIKKLPPMIFKAGLFTTEPKYVIEELATFCHLDLLEFDKDSLKADYRGFSQPIIKHVRDPQELEYNWSQTKVAMLQLPGKLLKKTEPHFQPIVLDVENEEDLKLVSSAKPYAVNLNYTGSLLKLISWIKWIKVAF